MEYHKAASSYKVKNNQVQPTDACKHINICQIGDWQIECQRYSSKYVFIRLYNFELSLKYSINRHYVGRVRCGLWNVAAVSTLIQFTILVFSFKYKGPYSTPVGICFITLFTSN
jgi:hypothetical protein